MVTRLKNAPWRENERLSKRHNSVNSPIICRIRFKFSFPCPNGPRWRTFKINVPWLCDLTKTWLVAKALKRIFSRLHELNELRKLWITWKNDRKWFGRGHMLLTYFILQDYEYRSYLLHGQPRDTFNGNPWRGNKLLGACLNRFLQKWWWMRHWCLGVLVRKQKRGFVQQSYGATRILIHGVRLRWWFRYF